MVFFQIEQVFSLFLMVQVQTLLSVADNSGAQIVRCIHIFNKQKVAKINDDLLVSVRVCLPNKKVKKGELYRAILIRKKGWYFRRKPGLFGIFFHSNAVILLNKRFRPVGSRLKGPLLQDFRKKPYAKILALASILI